MSESTKSALVIFSGGQDSTTCLAWALQKFHHVECVTFDYGQRHKVELTCSQKICQKLEVSQQIIPIDLFRKLTKNALTDNKIKIEQKTDQLPSTFVPGRNHIFLSVAGIIAQQKGFKNLVTGVCQTDYSGYPDCREEFIKSLEKTLGLAMAYPIKIHTPLMNLNKKETVELMKELGQLDLLKDSHTCYEGKRPACGICPACKLRIKGFSAAVIKDPLEYE